MRIKHLLYLLLALPMAFVACNDPEEPKPVQKDPVLTIVDTNLEFGAQGGVLSVRYTLENPIPSAKAPEIEATCEADWITNIVVRNTPNDSNYEEGYGQSVSLTALPNESEEAREATLVITYGELSGTATIKQSGEAQKPETIMSVNMAAAVRIPSSELDLADNYFALAFTDDSENIELGIVLVGEAEDTILKSGNYSSSNETLLAEACEVYVYEPEAEYSFVDGIAIVEFDEEAETYLFIIELSDEADNRYQFYYEGVVLDMVPTDKPEAEEFVPVKVEAYRADTWDLGNFELDLYIDENNYHSLDMQDLVAPNDKYLTAGHYSMEDGSITSWSNFVHNIETGEGAYIVAAELDLTHNADGTSTLKGYFESEYGNHLDIDWTGVIAGFDFSTVEPTPGETVEFTAQFFDGTYYGDGNYYIVVSDAEVTGSYGVDGGTYYYFDIYAGVETEDLSVPNGTYTFDKTNSYADGTFTEEYGFGFKVNGEERIWYLYAEGSKVTVSDNKIVAELILTDGSKHIVTYEGSLSLGGGVLSEDIEVNGTGWDVMVGYYGQYYNYDTDNYYIELFEDVETGNGGYFVLDILADYATCVDHSGTFTASEDFGINTFVSGYLEGGYLAGSWYAELEDGEATGVMAPLTDGTVTVTLNADGTETYTFDCKDDQGYKITGTVTANPYSTGYALNKGANKSKTYRMQLPKSVVR
ncbi:MAG: BACON domain-containing protein [Alistipes sp.]|nr:BACON domain-containing protein [Alistipes sp.]